jgi:ribonuclease-3
MESLVSRFTNLLTSNDDLITTMYRSTGYRFKNKSVLEEALTHTSKRVGNYKIATNQRLEQLGDSVLQFIITDYLFHKNPSAEVQFLNDERKKLVSNDKLREIAIDVGLPQNGLIGFAEGFKTEGFKGYCDFVESMIGAIYVDSGKCLEDGKSPVKTFIYRFWKLNP